MAFINSAQGIIKDALVFDSTGESLSSTIQLAIGLQNDSKLYCLLVRHIHVLPVVAEQLLKTAEKPLAPFTKNMRADAIKKELNKSKANYKILLQSIIPASIYNKKLIVHDVDMYKEPDVKPTVTGKELGATRGGTSVHSLLNYADMGDRVYASPTPEPTSRNSDPPKYKIYIYSPHYFNGFVELFKGVSNYIIEERKVAKSDDAPNPKTFGPNSTGWLSLKNGDIISGDDFLLIGIRSYLGYRNVIEKEQQTQQKRTPISLQDFIDKVRTSHYEPNKEVLIEVLGSELPVFSGQQLFYHMDMYLNYGGLTTAGRHLLFLAYLPDEVIAEYGKTPEKRAELIAIQRHLEQVYTKLASITFPDRSKFEIERIPILIDQWWNIFSFNNCITENSDTIAKCYIPHYTNIVSGLTDTAKVTSKLAEQYYRQAYTTIHLSGYQMVPIDVDKLLNVVSNQSLHCFVAVLRRE